MTPGSRTAKAVIAEARGWIGTPYRHQASLKGAGTDCLGLIRGIWRTLYGDEPEDPGPYGADWADASRAERLAAAAARHMLPLTCGEARPGDLLLFRWRPHLPARHAAILSARKRMIHAQDGVCVCEVHLSAWWHRRLSHSFRFPDMRF